MKMRNKLMSTMMIIAIIISSFGSLPLLKAASYNVYTVRYKCPVRTAANENSEAIKSGNDTVYVFPNQQLDYLKSATGPNNGKPNETWYAVKFDYAAREYTGYVAKACMYDVASYSYNDESAFEESIKNFPESYKPYLRRLHAAHPNWNFRVDKTGINWSVAAEAQSEKGTSAISYLYPSLIFKDSTNPNGIVVDGSSWYAPAKEAVMYYLDPRNFLNEKNIFMFETVSYNASQDASVSAILKGSFMSGSFSENGASKTYANAFIEAAKETNVSSSHLASRSLQEMGTTKGPAASGTVAGYEGYYNFYNIGAYSGPDNYLKGLQYAKDAGWNGIQKAITGGAREIGSRYINKGQDTMYFQKFNVSSYRLGTAHTHQYQTNIMAPSSESGMVYDSYKSSGKLNNSYTFTIPYYEGMPSSAFKVSRTDTVGGNTPPDEKPDDKPTEPVVSAEEKVAKSGYSLATGYLTNLPYGKDVSVIKDKLTSNGASTAVMNSSWGSKTSGIIATGDIVNVDNKNFTAVIYGDISGDGNITIKDLLLVQKHLLGSQSLSGPSLKAADVSKDNAVSIKDLLLIQKYLLGSGSINQ